MFKLKEFIKSLFVKWELVHSTHDAAKHFTMLSRLDDNGIKYKTKTITSGGGVGGGDGFTSIYEILVQNETISIANDAIHHSRF